jgi:pimeloyl-ACP methyl ester carboxylesterase
MDALGAPQCDLLGHSLGGMVALRFALAHPRRVASLVLMDTSAAPVGMMVVEPMHHLAALGRAEGMGRVFEAMRAVPNPARAEASRRCEAAMGEARYWARIRRKIESMDPDAMHALADLLADHTSAVPRLPEIGVPTLVLVGEEDRPFREPARVLAEGIAAARLAVVPAAAHSPQLENREAWLGEVTAHLGRVRAPRP